MRNDSVFVAGDEGPAVDRRAQNALQRTKSLVAEHGALGGVIPFLMIPVLFALSSFLIPGSATWNSMRAILLLSSMLGIASIGQTLVIMVGGIDLSIPAVVGMADVMVTVLNGDGWSFWSSALLIAAFSLGIGIFNGSVSRLLNTHSLVVTLASSYIILGGVLPGPTPRTREPFPTGLSMHRRSSGQRGRSHCQAQRSSGCCSGSLWSASRRLPSSDEGFTPPAPTDTPLGSPLGDLIGPGLPCLG